MHFVRRVGGLVGLVQAPNCFNLVRRATIWLGVNLPQPNADCLPAGDDQLILFSDSRQVHV